MARLDELLQIIATRKASDLHWSAGSPPWIRVDGKLVPLPMDPLTPEASRTLAEEILTPEQIQQVEAGIEVDLSFGRQGLGRFRANLFLQRGTVSGALRIIPFRIQGFEELGLPVDLCQKLCDTPKGLVLVTGATGSGKSTTLAAMVGYINSKRYAHIVTIEDPIEFLHKNKKCLVDQREVGQDTQSFREALRSVLRQDPDVIVVGEMRDRETIESALTLAETGHLTFGTLHTSDTSQTINRVIDVFPSHQQAQVRVQLAQTLQAVFSQQLLPRAAGQGRVLAIEILVATPAVRNLVRESKIHQLYSHIQLGHQGGMRTMNQSLAELVKRGDVAPEVSLEHSLDRNELRKLLRDPRLSGGVNVA